ncbi:LysM peptidoglycan-binding domain-containing protein [Oleiagrimonas citrea]|uniref:LysM peptidoglycan-binding domain-containing protein n=1 Tax=Oleiagrimonas citrea TaxID=1665687 RepID=A0A846ZPA9_9GAMM|nr:LysM peptidoglycan-binding domain-containing protein [Oleiagrimonas citrea]NKZ39876.1 LysM peptidoglycan-binding domain-containing protein [Oleiagrimonas citrea]
MLQGSLSQLGQGTGGSADLGLGRNRQYVNVANGNLVLQGQDAGLDFDGLSIANLRTYNSLGTKPDQGWLWGFSRNIRPGAPGSTVEREADDGSVVTYVYDRARGLYVSEDANGPQDTLLRLNGRNAGWLWTDGATHREETYDGSGKLVSIFDPRTSARYMLSYDHGHLSSITADDGDVLSFQYGKHGLLTQVDMTEVPPGATAAVTRTVVRYAYDDADRLVQVSTALASDSQATDALFTTRYTYEGDSLRIRSVTQSDGVVAQYSYTELNSGEFVVSSVTTGTGDAARTVHFAYDGGGAQHSTQVSDASGQTWTYVSDARGDLLSLSEPAIDGQRPVTQYTYDAAGNVLQATDALGHTTTYTYDAYGNRIGERDASGNTITRTFDDNHYLLTQTYYRATASTGTPDAATADTTRYVYDDTGRLRFTIDATGAVTERVYNGDGLLQTVRHYLGATFDIGHLRDDESPSLRSMTTWSARQDMANTTRSDFAYDARGLLAMQTDWAAVDANGIGVQDAATAVTHFVYDAQGLLRQQAIVRGSQSADLTSYAYDGMGRLIGRTSATGAQTTWSYAADGSVTSITVDASSASQPGTTRVRTEQRNSSGEVVAVTVSDTAGDATHVTDNIYDAAGRLRAVRAPDGGISYTFYDADGRVSARVDATGAVTEYQRDADGRVVGTVMYANRVDTRAWLVDGDVVPQDVDAIRPAASAEDRATATTYDATGRIATNTDAVGTVTHYAYDGESHLVRTTVIGGDGGESRVTRYFYDADGRRIATLDAAGDLSEVVYDEAGRRVRDVAYATVTDVALRADGTLAQLRPAASAGDQVTRHYYDGRGEEVASLDAAGYVTRYDYDEATHQRTTTRYAQAISTGSDPSLQDVLDAVAGQDTQVSTCQYDADGRKIAETNAEGTTTTYTYDGFGRLVRTEQAVGTQDSRVTKETYDVFGNRISETDGNGKVTYYTYDAEGRPLSVTDPLGQTTWTVYDADGRVRYRIRGMADASGTLNAQGEVVEYRYDAFGDVTQTLAYAHRLALPSGFAPTEAGMEQGAATLTDATHDGHDVYRYDTDGRLIEHVDGDGYVTRYGYDAFGDRTSETVPQDATHTSTNRYTFDALGRRISSVEDVAGVHRVTSATYDALGHLSSTTDGRGVVTHYRYDGLDRETSRALTVDGTARVVRTQYDAYGRVLVHTDALGQSTHYAYDEANRTVTVTSPEGVTLSTQHNREGQTIAVTDAAGHATKYRYDADGRLVQTERADGSVEQASYDADGHRIRTVDGDGRSVVYTYDAAGRVLSRTTDPDGLALTTRYVYDGRGQKLSVTAPDGMVTTYDHDADGNVMTQVEDAGDASHRNLTTTYTWDAQGRQLSVTRGSGTAQASTTSYTYDALGRETRQVVAAGTLDLTTDYAYDAEGHLVRVTDPAGAKTYYAYDEAGERTYTLAPTGAPGSGKGTLTRTTYDADGRVTSVTGFAASVDATGADALISASPSDARTYMAGLAAQAADPQSDHVAYRVYDHDGHLRFTLDGAGAVVETRYNALGERSATLSYAGFHAVPANLAAAIQSGDADDAAISTWLAGQGVTDTHAGTTRYYYDALDRVRFRVVLDQVGDTVQGVISETRYDATGQVIATVQHGTTLSLAGIDAATTDSLAAQTADDGAARTTRYLYDQAGRQRAVIGADGATTFRFYDAAGRVTATVDADGAVVAFDYDSAGRMVSRTAFVTQVSTQGWVDGDAVVPADCPLPSAHPAGTPGSAVATGGHDRTTRYTYDALGRLTQKREIVDSVRGLDASGSAAKLMWDERVTIYRYDAASRQVAETVASALTGTSRTTSWLYDADGRRVAQLDASGYLTETVYDSAGRVQRTVAYAQAVALPDGADPTTFPLAQLRPQTHAADRTTRYYYDGLGQRIGMLDAEGYLTAYAYDGDGREVSQTRYANELTGHETEDFAALQALAAKGAARQTQRNYDAQGRLVETVNAEGTHTKYAYDANGWLLSTDEAAGTSDSRVTQQRFDAFGEVVASTDSNQHTTRYTYDAAGRRTSMTDALGNRTWFVYDLRGQLAFTVRGMADDSGRANAWGEITQVDLDAFGQTTRSVTYARRLALDADPAFDVADLSAQVATLAQPYAASGSDSSYDVAATYAYDSVGDLIAKTDGKGQITAYAYDIFGEKTSQASLLDADGQRVSVENYAYDADGRVTETRRGVVAGSALDPALVLQQSGKLSVPLQVIRSEFDAFGEVSARTDARGSRTIYAYDHLGHRVAQALSVQGSERTQSSTYDAFGRVVTRADALGRVTRLAYDDAQRSLTVTTPEGVVTITQHNREGQTIAVTDANGQTTRYRYDGAGQRVEIDDANGAREIRAYDATGHLHETVDADGRVIRYDYDAAGRVLTQTVDPDGAALVTQYTYDAAGHRLSMTDPSQVVTDYTYDGNGNLLTQVEDAGDDTHLNLLTRYNWDAQGHKLSVTYGTGSDAQTNTYAYDGLGRLVSETDGAGHQRTYDYDANGNLIHQVDANGKATYFVYNEAGEKIFTIQELDGGLSACAVSQQFYDADGRQVGTHDYARTVDLSSALQSSATVGGFFAESEVAAATAAVQDSADQQSFRVYDGDGRLRFVVQSGGRVTETRYNTLGQVAQTLAYAAPVQIDAALAGALQSGTANVATIQSALSAVGDSATTARQTFTYYDAAGRIRFQVQPTQAEGVAGGAVTEMRYDAAGHVIATLHYGSLLAPADYGEGATTASIADAVAGRDAHRVRSVYDAAGRLVYTIDAAGLVQEQCYDAAGRTTLTRTYVHAVDVSDTPSQDEVAAALSAANPQAGDVRVTGQTYDAAGRVVATYDGLPAPATRIRYNNAGQKIASTDRDGHTTTYAYNAQGLVSDETGPEIDVATYNSEGAYNGTVKDRVHTHFEYDNEGRLLSRTQQQRDGNMRVSYTYDARGNQIATFVEGDRNAAGSSFAAGTRVTYNALDQAVVSRDVRGHYSYKVYDAAGRVAYDVGADGYVTHYVYDAYGDQVQVTRYAQGLNFGKLTASGWKAGDAITDALIQKGLVASSGQDRTLTTTYDQRGNKLSVMQANVSYVHADGSTGTGHPTTRYTYDAYGHLSSESVLIEGAEGRSPAVWATTFHYYDADGRKTETVDPMGYVTTWTYDGFGNIASMTEWARPVSTDKLSAGGTPPATPDAGDLSTGFDRITRYTWDQAGRKVTESSRRYAADAEGTQTLQWATTHYTYDGEGRIIAVDTDGKRVTTDYDAMGRVVRVTGPGERVLRNDWHALLQAHPDWDLSSSGLYVQTSETVSYVYDSFGERVVETHGSTGSSLAQRTYTRYDGGGRAIASVSTPDGTADWSSSYVKRMRYDNAGNQIEVDTYLTGLDGNTVKVTTTSNYDADNRLVDSATHRAGQSAPDKASVMRYNAFGEQTGSGVLSADEQIAVYDAAGRRIRATDPTTGVVHSYGYDLAGRMVLDTHALAADVGGSVSTRHVLDRDGRVTGVEAPSGQAASGEGGSMLAAEYDRWGNVLSSTDFNGNTTLYRYNDRSQVVQETGAAVAVTGENGQTHTTTTTKSTVYDIDGNVVASTDENGHTTHITRDALGRAVKTVDGANATQYTAFDGLGREVADEDGNGHITFKNLDALGRTVQQGDFVVDGSGRHAVWQQAYVLDENGDRLVAYDGIGSSLLQKGQTEEAADHANYYGYDSQGRILWSQDPAQHAATADSSGSSQSSSTWTARPYNPGFEEGDVGWVKGDGWSMVNSSHYSGSWSARLDNFGASNAVSPGSTLINQDRVPVRPGQAIHASAMVQQGASDVGHTGAAVRIMWYAADGSRLGYSTGNYIVDGRHGEWHSSSLDATAPSGAAYAAVAVNGWNISLDPLWVDDISWNYVPQIDVKDGPDIRVPAGATNIRTTYAYDAYGHKVHETNADGDSQSWTYDAYGRLTAHTDLSGAKYHYEYDAASGQLVHTDDNWSASAQGQADPPYVMDTAADSATRTYYANGQLATLRYADGSHDAYFYDANGNMVRKESYAVDGNGKPVRAVTEMTYDSHNRLTHVTETRTDGGTREASASTQLQENLVPIDGDGGGGYGGTGGSGGSTNDPVPDSWAVVTSTMNLTYRYDAVGNRRAVIASESSGSGSGVTTQLVPIDWGGGDYSGGGTGTGGSGDGGTGGSTATAHSEAWYTYDGDNRVLVSAGKLVNGSILISSGAASYGLNYDAAGHAVARTTKNADGHTLVQRSHFNLRGELVQADYTVDLDTGGNYRGFEEQRQYDANGRVIASEHFYAMGTRLNPRLPYRKYTPDDFEDFGDDLGDTLVGGELSSATIDHYDPAGHLIEEQNFGHASQWTGAGGQSNVPTDLPGANALDWGGMTLQNRVVYRGPEGQAGYDAMGHVLNYQYRDAAGRVDAYTVSYVKKDAYLEKATAGVNITGTANVRPTTDQSVYNDRGERVAIAQQVQYQDGAVKDVVRVFAYDGAGQIITRRDGTADGSAIDSGDDGSHAQQHYVYANGQQVASFDEGATLNVLDQVTAFSNTDRGTGGYVVQAGDSLKSIAQSIYGNASLWYVIADANALGGDDDLALGQTLQIPEVTTHSNDATTFKPYNPSEIQGSTTPSLPTIAPPPPPPSHHCNAVAAIVVIAIVVVATIVTAGAAAVAMGATEGVFAAGGAALAGSVAGITAGEAIAAAAIGGFVGNIAGQLAGDALGTHHGFSFGEALVGGLTTAAGAGIGEAISGSGSATSALAKANGALRPAGAALLGASSYASNATASKLLHQPTHFSWAGLVASGVAAGLTNASGVNRLGGTDNATTTSASSSMAGTVTTQSSGTFESNIASGFLSGAIDREASIALGDGRVPSWEQIGEDAFGNALGNAAVHKLTQVSEERRLKEQRKIAAAMSYYGNKQDSLAPYRSLNIYGATDPLASYNPSDYPMLASTDTTSTYAGVNGAGPEPANPSAVPRVSGASNTNTSNSNYENEYDLLSPDRYDWQTPLPVYASLNNLPGEAASIVQPPFLPVPVTNMSAVTVSASVSAADTLSAYGGTPGESYNNDWFSGLNGLASGMKFVLSSLKKSGASNVVIDNIKNSFSVTAYNQASRHAKQYMSAEASRSDLSYREKAIEASGYAGRMQAQFSQAGIPYSNSGFEHLLNATNQAYASAGFVYPGDENNFLVSSSPESAGKVIAGMIPGGSNLLYANPYSFGGQKVSGPDGEFAAPDNPSLVLVGAVTINRSVWNSAFKSYVDMSWDGVSKNPVPGLAPEDYEGGGEFPEGMQSRSEMLGKYNGRVQAVVAGINYFAKVYQGTTAGRVQVFYNSTVKQYQVVVQKYHFTPVGWTYQTVSQQNDLFKMVQQGIHR